ncbi:hypothetical protein FM042_05105 [Aliidiomarina halalkaliphila]|uniref:Uncharacterized protein n=1 Tax=Aliidiomarina halalkaliphila TaxID=2593535 RepID=A0A552X5H1_9GAMM|nr:M66 family metalloprotease [Aliidiomarina halalkaliphila]TRW50216.1 hypothetical protein FM042_05105 [Aliidiomarina halalkaliphila]
MKKYYPFIASSVALLVLTACGGGGSGGGGGTGGGTGGGGNTPQSYTVSTTTGTGASITPASATVQSGNTAEFSIDYDDGYEHNNAHGCGGSYSDGTYTTGAISSNCTVTVTARRIQFTASATLEGGGSITPESETVDAGETVTFTVELDPYYSITNVSGCNAEEPVETGDQTFTIETAPMDANCELAVTAETPGPDVFYDVSVDIQGEGSVDPESARGNFGDTFSFTLTPADGFELGGATGCDGTLEGDVYTTGALVGDCTVTVRFLDEEAIFFADENLESALLDHFGRDAGDSITAEDMETLTSLNLDNKSIISLAGMEAAINLHTLSLFRNSQLSNLSPLRDLPITNLNVNDTAVNSLNIIAELPIVTLRIQDTGVTDLTPLAGKDSLQTLIFSYTEVSSLKPLENNSNLRTVLFYDTPVRDLRPLVASGMTNGNVQGFGCMSNTHRATASAIDTLRERGNSVATLNRQTRFDCGDYRPNIDGDVEVSFADDQLHIDWTMSSNGDLSDLACEIHFDLYDQTARVPYEVIEPCDTTGNLTVNATQSAYRVTVLFDDGLDAQHRADAPRIQKDGVAHDVRFETADWGQVMLKTSPLLVPNRAAMFRAHIAGPAAASVPTGRLELSLNGDSTTLDMTPPNGLVGNKVHGTLSNSFHTEVPAQWMQDGLTVRVLMDGDVVHEQTPKFSPEIPLYITVVPMVMNGVTPVVPDDETIIEQLQVHWPLSRIEIRRRAAYTVRNQDDVEDAADLLYQLQDLRAADGESEGSHYHGFFDFNEVGGNSAGVAFVPGRVGVTWDRADRMDTFSHEMGHNFSIRHIDCGNPANPEPDFPYNPSSIGSVGVNLDNDELISPSNHADVMGYCRPRHISDWVYEKAQDYLLLAPSQSFTTGGETASDTANNNVLGESAGTVTRISGVVHPFKGTVVRSMMEVPRPAVLDGNSPYTILASDASGKQFSVPISVIEDSTTQGTGTGYFEAYIDMPLESVQHVQIFRGEAQLLDTPVDDTQVLYYRRQ